MFLFSLLGETELMSGSFKMNGSSGFLSFKRAAFVSGTVRDNITLFERFDKKLYQEACHIGMVNTGRMPGDDFMVVSEGGSNLFAKEKMQILVARLIYQNFDILIIDDFFDLLTPVQRDIYSKHLLKYCKTNNKTIFYVSAYELLAKKADKIFYFNNCSMIANIHVKDLKIDGVVSCVAWEKVKDNEKHFKTFIEQRTDKRPLIVKRTTRLPGFNLPPWYENLL